MELIINGKVKTVLEPQTGVGKKGTWIKQEFVIETNDQYPKTICFTAWGDLTDVVSSLRTGEEIVVSFNPESREYNGKYYTDLKAWKIEQNHGMDKLVKKVEKQGKTTDFIPVEDSEDLPF